MSGLSHCRLASLLSTIDAIDVSSQLKPPSSRPVSTARLAKRHESANTLAQYSTQDNGVRTCCRRRGLDFPTGEQRGLQGKREIDKQTREIQVGKRGESFASITSHGLALSSCCSVISHTHTQHTRHLRAFEYPFTASTGPSVTRCRQNEKNSFG